MKSTVLYISLFACSLFSAQQVSDYPYVAVQEHFSAKKLNQFGLKKNLTNLISAKKYSILPENSELWPTEAKQNPCGVLKADLQDISTMLKNKVRIVLQDCNNKSFTFDGASLEKSYEVGFPDALDVAAKNIPASKGTLPKISAQEAQKTLSQTAEPEPNIVKNFAQYLSGTQKFQKINISGSQFIFTVENSTEPFATFTKSLKDGIFHVLLKDKTQALGYIENQNLIIETLSENGNIHRQVFTPKDY